MPPTLLSAAITKNPAKDKILKLVKSLKRGYYYTKEELAEKAGFSPRSVEKWGRRYPELRKHHCYVMIGGRRMTVFVNTAYRKELLKKGIAKEVT